MGFFGALASLGDLASIGASLFVVGCTGLQLAGRNLNLEIRPVSNGVPRIAVQVHVVSV
ncbi:MAG: hypothetical protein O7B98_18885 [Alphaproteobacteria bacterium]|nr:hypothetical protein [Alphaproteobacteria bacterium]